jgi:hypothetical protein
MGTVTGYTAQRMKGIEDGTVVDGDVVGDNLILTKHDGTTINAGNVRGPQGPVGPDGPPGGVTARGLVWRYDVGALPAAQRQVTSGTANGTIVIVVPSVSPVTFDTTRRYQYMLNGVVIFDTAGGGGDIWITQDGVNLANMWQGRASGAGYSFTMAGISQAFKPALSNSVVAMNMRRTVGGGTMTLEPAYGAMELMLFDVGQMVP